ncbi:MAG: hypothetical protein K2X35_21070 [Bryobacteraceae bacterium]|nr:hypothetical protein [Bryobacteraceae bacterium]
MEEFRVLAHNSASQSDNKIHDDAVAARFGFRGGLVPGVVIYGYMTTPVVAGLGPEWLERGAIDVRFQQPFYEGEVVVTRLEPGMTITAAGEDGVVRASGKAWLHNDPVPVIPVAAPVPAPRRQPVDAEFEAATLLGSFRRRLDDVHQDLRTAIQDPLDCYQGQDAATHPAVLLGLANEILTRSYELGPWIHASSEVRTFRKLRVWEQVEVRGLVEGRFERKGHRMATLFVVLLDSEDKVCQSVRHTAIYQLRGA